MFCDLASVYRLIQPAYERHPAAEHSVGQTSCPILIFRPFGFQKPLSLIRIGAVERLSLHRILRLQIFPPDVLEEIFSVPQFPGHIFAAPVKKSAVRSDILSKILPYPDYAVQCSGIETGAHAVRSPELYVIGVVMRLFHRSVTARIPCADAIIHTLLYLRVQRTYPAVISADAPLPVNLHYAAELSVSGRVEVVLHRTDRKIGAEHLMAFGVLIDKELRLPETSLHPREQMRHSLRIIPYVSAGPVTASPVVSAAFPRPEPSVVLAHDGG